MALDGLVLNGVSLNDETNFGLEAIDFTPPKKKPEWAAGADSDGSDLIRPPLYENRVVTMTLKVGPQASKNAALAKVGELTDLLQEAEKNPGGIPLEWTPASSSKTVTFYVLMGEITSIPMGMEGAGAGFYFGNAPSLTVQLTCKPFGYGVEKSVAAKANETGFSTVVLVVPTVEGDVPAEGRLVVADTAAVGRRFVEWGLENRYYNAANPLVVDNESLTAVGGTQSTALNSSGAYKPGGATKGTLATTLLPEATVCCETAALKHIGTYRVKARVQAVLGAGSEAAKVQVRLSWQDGEGPLRANPWQSLSLGGVFVEVDLGQIAPTEAKAGVQKWLGRIEAFSANTAAADVLHVDYLTLIPVGEGYGRARGVTVEQPGTITAFDNFSTGTLSGSLNGRTPPVGAVWATSGAATDWTVEAGKLTRKTSSESEPRFGVLGAALTNSQASVAATIGGEVTAGVVLRWVNATNYAFLSLTLQVVSGSIQRTWKMGVVVAGATTVLSESILAAVPTTFTVTLVATADGALTGTYPTYGGGRPVTVTASNSALATGGALASGKGGIFQRSLGSAVTQAFSAATVTSLPAAPYVVQPSRTMEVRSDTTIAQDPSGTYYGPVPQYRGSRFFIPQDGSANRETRILVKADRNDLEASDEQTIADSFTARAYWTPRYSVVPR